MQFKHSRRRRMEKPSFERRESITLSSRLLHFTQRIRRKREIRLQSNYCDYFIRVATRCCGVNPNSTTRCGNFGIFTPSDVPGRRHCQSPENPLKSKSEMRSGSGGSRVLQFNGTGSFSGVMAHQESGIIIVPSIKQKPPQRAAEALWFQIPPDLADGAKSGNWLLLGLSVGKIRFDGRGLVWRGRGRCR